MQYNRAKQNMMSHNAPFCDACFAMSFRELLMDAISVVSIILLIGLFPLALSG